MKSQEVSVIIFEKKREARGSVLPLVVRVLRTFSR